METVDVYTERGDLVTCSDCGKVMLLPYGADKCPACKKEGCLVWTDESLREADIDSLLEEALPAEERTATGGSIFTFHTGDRVYSISGR